MTGEEIYNKALAITGYASSALSDLTAVNEQALHFVNIAYADLFYLKKAEGFLPLAQLSDSPDLSEAMTQDCIGYFVAALIANMLGCDEDYSLYKSTYEEKKKRFKSYSTITEISDVLPKEWD